jgi:hypothetical protein
MNDKINELIDKTHLRLGSEPDRFEPVNFYEFMIIFSELLVQECALTASMVSINKTQIHPDIPVDNMSVSAQNVYHSTCQTVAEEIRKLTRK